MSDTYKRVIQDLERVLRDADAVYLEKDDVLTKMRSIQVHMVADMLKTLADTV